ncbi:hypothetical protein V6N13_033642 [Hibiscus sabdariffa]
MTSRNRNSSSRMEMPLLSPNRTSVQHLFNHIIVRRTIPPNCINHSLASTQTQIITMAIGQTSNVMIEFDLLEGWIPLEVSWEQDDD